MDIGRITESELREALELLRQARPLVGNALLELELLRVRLRMEGVGESPEGLEWALGSLLSETIWQHLATLRGPRSPRTVDGLTPGQERALLAADFAEDNLELEAWSGLYYRYMCRLGLHVQEIAAIARPGYDHGRKHVQRRMARGLDALTQELRVREQAAARQRRAVATPSAGARLPVAPTPLTGREHDVTALVGRMPEERLLTLTGPGGIGKTRLALEVARRLADELPDELPDGAWWIELAPLADGALVAPTVGAAFGLDEATDRPWPVALADALSDRRLLLVLDNMEHVVAPCATLADALLRSCRRMRILATSREPLQVPGEQVWPVPPLDVPEPEAAAPGTDAGAPAADAGAPAVLLPASGAATLFVERAAAAAPGFRLTRENAAAVARICRQLDGIPLAIELAAARVRTLSPAELAERLDDRFRLLVGGSRAAQPHQQTLRATMDWSHELLTPAERACFRRLAVLRGGFALGAAEAVCAGGELDPADALDPADVLDMLSRLVDKSLIVVDRGGAETRYGVLETIRLYAQERLVASGELAPASFRQLHGQAGTALERLQPESVERLAYQFARSEDCLQAMHYLDLAARKARREYANDAALGFYRQALAFEERPASRQGEVETLHILGRREEEAEALRILAAAPDTPAGAVAYHSSRYHEARADYDAACSAA